MKYKFIIVICLATMALFACNKTTNPESLVREWVGREIVFPADAVFMVQGDTVEYEPTVNDFNIIVYIDSAGCTECKMRMPAWNAFMSEINRYDACVGLCFALDGIDAIRMAQIAKRNDFRYPFFSLPETYMDFPDEHLYQTFLLDDSSRVIAVGNPLGNESISRLYRHIVTRGRNPGKENFEPKIAVSSKRVPMGVIRPGDEKNVKVSITNNGDSLVTISKITTSCHCTTAKAQSDTIRHGQSVELDITQSNDSTYGYFTREVYIFIDANPNPVQIELTGFMSN